MTIAMVDGQDPTKQPLHIRHVKQHSIFHMNNYHEKSTALTFTLGATLCQTHDEKQAIRSGRYKNVGL